MWADLIMHTPWQCIAWIITESTWTFWAMSCLLAAAYFSRFAFPAWFSRHVVGFGRNYIFIQVSISATTKTWMHFADRMCSLSVCAFMWVSWIKACAGLEPLEFSVTIALNRLSSLQREINSLEKRKMSSVSRRSRVAPSRRQKYGKASLMNVQS